MRISAIAPAIVGSVFLTAAWAAPSDAGRSIVQVRETDTGVDGSVDRRVSVTWVYDQQGALVRKLTLTDEGADGTIDLRETYLAEYGAHGRLLHDAFESDAGADGTIELRRTNVVSDDPLGEAVVNVEETDFGADGTIEERRTAFHLLDNHGFPEVIALDIDVPAGGIVETHVDTAYAYDSHGNLEGWVANGRDANDDPLFLEQASRTYDGSGDIQVGDLWRDEGVDGSVELQEVAAYFYEGSGNLVLAISEVHRAGEPENDRVVTSSTYGPGKKLLGSVTDASVGGLPTSRTTYTPTFSSPGDLLSEVFDVDDLADGTIDSREVVTWEYAGSGGQPDAEPTVSLDRPAGSAKSRGTLRQSSSQRSTAGSRRL